MGLIIVTVIAVALVMLGMSVGVLFTGKCLRGSCGGPDVLGPDGESVLCATCPNRASSDEAA